MAERYLDTIFNDDVIKRIGAVPGESVDLIIADPPYCLGKDYGNDSDKLRPADYLAWSYSWIDAVLPTLKDSGSFYLFLTWQYSPEIFSYIKKRLLMINEIIWDRRVPSMGGSVRSYSSVHDTIGFFAKTRRYYFDLDSVRIPYDPDTKKARARARFAGAKWLELGCNPKDLWSVPRLHRQDAEREAHPTQKPLKIIDRMVTASCPPGGVVLDPFMGSGTTAVSCRRHGRHYVGFELNSAYCALIDERLRRAAGC
ncbi:MAG: site-specific DNA-methyltransferase [Treponema sp.]|jgi:site-specific DNA-methyltransferase (adenine-specific)|nr:site-specific DNA-methyltransferase [Treponema sp.]